MCDITIMSLFSKLRNCITQVLGGLMAVVDQIDTPPQRFKIFILTAKTHLF